MELSARETIATGADVIPVIGTEAVRLNRAACTPERLRLSLDRDRRPHSPRIQLLIQRLRLGQQLGRIDRAIPQIRSRPEIPRKIHASVIQTDPVA